MRRSVSWSGGWSWVAGWGSTGASARTFEYRGALERRRSIYEKLSTSQNDDELRWKTYYAIYRDPFLARYAPGGGVLRGHRHPFDGGFHAITFRRFPGMEPLGDYPLHIIVKQGTITLLGVLDS